MNSFIFPALLVVIGALFYGVIPPSLYFLELDNPTGVARAVYQGGQVCFWAAAASFLNRLTNLLFWKGFFNKRHNVLIPKLLQDMVGVLVWLICGFLCLRFVFDFQIAGLVTASGVTIAIIGFALRNMISDLFTGLAMGIEQPMRTGDWIELEDGMVGYVEETNWRATRIITRDEITKIIPNSLLATNAFINYSRPDPFFRDQFQIVLGYDVTSHQAERLLLSAISQIAQSTDIPRKPEVRVHAYLEHGVSWELQYWVPDYGALSLIRNKVQRNVLRNLHYAGVQVARNKLEFLDLDQLRAEKTKLSEDMAFLRSIELFDPLSDEDLEKLHHQMTRRLCLANDPVVYQGDMSNTSLYLVQEGFLNVSLKNEQEQNIQVGWLAPGMFFGEMSLLTGEKRSASVIPTVDSILLEIKKDDIAPILQHSDKVVKKLSQILANRQKMNDETLSKSAFNLENDSKDPLSDLILQKITSFFGLKS